MKREGLRRIRFSPTHSEMLEALEALTLVEAQLVRDDLESRLKAVDMVIEAKAKAPKAADKLMDKNDVARELRVSKSTAAELLRNGNLPRTMVGRYVRTRASDVEAYIKRGGSR